jgi:hypothetical protein
MVFRIFRLSFFTAALFTDRPMTHDPFPVRNGLATRKGGRDRSLLLHSPLCTECLTDTPSKANPHSKGGVYEKEIARL